MAMHRQLRTLALRCLTAGAALLLSGFSPASAATTVGLPWHFVPTAVPVGPQRPAVALGRDGNVYVFGGFNPQFVDVSSTYIYHPATHSWTEGANMPIAREGAQAVTLPDGRIAVLGGAINCDNTELCTTGTVYAEVDVYTPSTDSWTTVTPMQSPRFRFAAVWFRGLIYAFGGSNGSAVLASAEAYNPGTNTWTYVAGLPQAEMAPAAAVDATGRVDVMGGTDAQGTYGNDALFRYDGAAWSVGATLPQATEDAAATPGADGQIYLLGGYNNGFLATVQAYNPFQNQWSLVTSLPSVWCCSGAVTLRQGQIYAVGGFGSPGNLTQVAAYGPGLSLSSYSGLAGATMALDGGDFAPDAVVDVYWGSGAAKTLLASGTTGSSGFLVHPVLFDVPSGASPGVYTVTAEDQSSRYPVRTSFVVTG